MMKNLDKCAFTNCGRKSTCRIVVAEYPPRFQELSLCSYHQRTLASSLPGGYRVVPDISEDLRSAVVAILEKEGTIQAIKYVQNQGFILKEAKPIVDTIKMEVL